MDAMVLKAHLVTYTLSLLLYLLRGGMLIGRSASVNARPLLAVVSLLSITLFASGVYLGFVRQLSFADGYMMSKIIGFLLYISLGVIALKPGLGRGQSMLLWLLGLLAFVYTFLLATQKLPPLYG